MKRLIMLGLLLSVMPDGLHMREATKNDAGALEINVESIEEETVADAEDTDSGWNEDTAVPFLRNIIRKRRHGHHLYDQIMHEMNKGHVTMEKVNHWYKEIQNALHTGEMTMDDFNRLVDALKNTSFEHGESCCWFG